MLFIDAKKIYKNIARSAGWLALILCSLIIKVVPGRMLYGFARGVSFVAYRCLAKQRRLALESLGIAFGNKKATSELAQIAKDSFSGMAKSAIELIYLLDKPTLLYSSIEFIGKEHLDNALAKGKGVILVSAHFGNFPLLLARLAIAGYPISGIMRPMRDPRVEKIFQEKRRICKVKTIYSQPRNVCVSKTIEVLRKNEIVFIPIDQNFGTGGIFVDFFGRKAATATGPIVFAQRTKAALIPCFIVRQKDDRHKAIFEAALDLDEVKDAEETIRINIQKLTGIIESYIRRYPEEWEWIHRRWKSKPSQQFN
jgi:KDO2-lipid IV(A) lauroyltransferase